MKKIIKIIILLIIVLLISSNLRVEAVLQSNGDAGKTYNLNDWMLNARRLESVDGYMGIYEKNVKSDLTSSEKSNGIDIHMQKNSEYGAIAILSASQYGSENKVENGGTTTGNATGVVINLNSEWVAAGSATYCANFNNARPRYKNLYNYSYSSRNGDAMAETQGWYGGSSSWGAATVNGRGGGDGWVQNAGIVRSVSGSLFSYDGYLTGYWNYYAPHWDRDDSSYSASHYTRAVIIQAEDI